MTMNNAKFPAPYLVYLGNVEVEDACKTGFGIAEWAGENTLGQYRSSQNTVSVGLPDMTIEQAAKAGVKSLIIGIAGVGGYIDEAWYDDLRKAAQWGINIVSGCHHKLAQVPGLQEIAEQHGSQLIEIRNPAAHFPVGNGIKRPGKRLLTVGTDCALGKKYTALCIAKEMRLRCIPADFRATGQTGIMISGSGIPIDSIVSDFVAGAAEQLSPAADAQHWDIIEGQGSLIHPSYAAVTLGLLHGSQPDEIVLCHDPRRVYNGDCSHIKIPPLHEVLALYLMLGRLTNPAIRCRAISLNTKGMSAIERQTVIEKTQQETGLIVFDPFCHGVAELINALDISC